MPRVGFDSLDSGEETSKLGDFKHRMLRTLVLLTMLLAAWMLSAGVLYAAPAEAVRISPVGGLFSKTVTVTLKASSTEAPVYYTTDGREPRTNSTVYQGPIKVDRSVCVRARVIPTNAPPGPVSAAGFTLIGPELADFTSNLPIIILSTHGGYVMDDDKRPGWLYTIHTNRGRAALNGQVQFHGRIGVELRGSSSGRFPKRSFGFEIREENSDDDVKASLLGLPAESDWILYAPYTDKSLMRDVLAYDLWEEMGHYSVRRRFVELFCTTHTNPLGPRDYAGVYVLLEKIKQGKNRLNIAKLTPNDTNEPAITGGYIIKKDRLDDNDNGWTTSWGHSLGIEYPKANKITSSQTRYIRQWFNEFESALQAPHFRDPERGYRKYLDVPTAIDFFWMVEMPKTIDGYTLSVFMHKDRNGKLMLSPIWDRNLSFGNANYQEGDNPHGWFWSVVNGRDLWFGRLFRDPEFDQACTDRWGELRRGLFATSNLLARVDAYAALLDEAQQREFDRWPRLGQHVWPNAEADWRNRTYLGTLQYMKNFMASRLAWLDRQFLPVPKPNAPAGVIAPGFQLFLGGTNQANQAVYYTLNGADPRGVGGEPHTNAVVFKEPILIQQKTRVIARLRNDKGVWSPPWSGVYVVDKR